MPIFQSQATSSDAGTTRMTKVKRQKCSCCRQATNPHNAKCSEVNLPGLPRLRLSPDTLPRQTLQHWRRPRRSLKLVGGGGGTVGQHDLPGAAVSASSPVACRTGSTAVLAVAGGAGAAPAQPVASPPADVAALLGTGADASASLGSGNATFDRGSDSSRRRLRAHCVRTAPDSHAQHSVPPVPLQYKWTCEQEAPFANNKIQRQQVSGLGLALVREGERATVEPRGGDMHDPASRNFTYALKIQIWGSGPSTLRQRTGLDPWRTTLLSVH